ncbi:hypothetical protein UCDDA912_g05440 [Diaporthe ampelina]|uniref:DUF7514 domain-containing protein n=1 Tax=Diaporthe ampelina TaxID=1214573 RepID=A0A0G2HHL2_9PEZI|nr:hypothetical protein UCDDA912_g05440 [Diaporthe ampelina]
MDGHTGLCPSCRRNCRRSRHCRKLAKGQWREENKSNDRRVISDHHATQGSPTALDSRSGVDDARKASSTKDARQLTAIDQKWGVLFAADGEPTKRMEHVVKGLANYIIDEFMPQNSIVITPEKMAAFYSHHRLDKEVFPFAVLFKSRSKHLHEALESLYEELGCQYFLAPVDSRSRPSVPGLTPAGFKHWIVSFVQAYPDEEAKRLDKVVSALPIEADSLLDGKPERLPKQISRYLLPEKPSVPSGLNRDDVGADRRSSTISAAAASVAAAVLRPSSRAAMSAAHLASQGMSSSTPALDMSARDPRAGGDPRDKRPSLDESMPRAPTSAFNLRDKAGLESSSSSKQSKRRSMVLPDKGPTWDDYLKSSAPKSSTSSFMKRADPGYHSSG